MNRVSASALDLMASALAAIMLLYIVTLQEILLFTKTESDKRAILVHFLIKKSNDKCMIGVFLEKENESFFPQEKNEYLTIEPKTFGAFEYKVQIEMKAGMAPVKSIVVVLHKCNSLTPSIQRLDVNVLGGSAPPRFQVTIPPEQVAMRLDIEQLKKGQSFGAWGAYAPKKGRRN